MTSSSTSCSTVRRTPRLVHAEPEDETPGIAERDIRERLRGRTWMIIDPETVPEDTRAFVQAIIRRKWLEQQAETEAYLHGSHIPTRRSS